MNKLCKEFSESYLLKRLRQAVSNALKLKLFMLEMSVRSMIYLVADNEDV